MVKTAGTKEVLGVVTGQLLNDWRKYNLTRLLLKFELEERKHAFFRAYLKKKIDEGDYPHDVEAFSKEVNEAFVKEEKEFIKHIQAYSLLLDTEKFDLWDRTYKELGLNPKGVYTLSMPKGEVFAGVDEDE